MTNPFSDFLGRQPSGEQMLWDAIQRQQANDPRTRIQKRRECEANGHKYQVHGKTSPTKVGCSRCGCSWAIGPKTEPTP